MAQDISNDVEQCRVPDINSAGMCSYDPSVETAVLETSLGKVVVQKRSYLSSSDIRAGLFVDTEKVEEKHYSRVYVVQSVTEEKDRLELSKVLRNECDQRGTITFF